MRSQPPYMVTSLLEGLVGMGARSEDYVSDRGDPIDGLKTSLTQLILLGKQPQSHHLAAWYLWWVLAKYYNFDFVIR